RDEGLRLERLSGSEVRELEPVLSPAVRSALLFPGDHQVDNRLLSRALWFSAEASGAVARIGSRVTRMMGGKELTLELDGGERLSPGAIVLAAGSWSGSIA